jgi:hypothetical protein
LFIADMSSRWFVWVGYKFADPDLRALFLATRDSLANQHTAKPPFVVYPLVNSPAGPEGQAEFSLSTAIWKARGVTFLPGRAEVFLPALVEQVRSAKAEKLVAALLRKRRLDPEDPNEVDKIYREIRALPSYERVASEADEIVALAKLEGVTDDDLN